MNLTKLLEESGIKVSEMVETYKTSKKSGSIALSIQVNIQMGGVSGITKEIKDFETIKK